MFGLHYETIQAQSKLDECVQAWNESFGDFWVQFEDIALMTEYDDRALRWRLLKQIQNHLQHRLVDHGEIPDTLSGVMDKLMVLDGARQVFNQVGLGHKENNYTLDSTAESVIPTNSGRNQIKNAVAIADEDKKAKSSSTIPKYNIRTPPDNQGLMQVAEDAHLESSIAEEVLDTENIQGEEKSYPKVTQEEWNHWMREGLCAVCGSKEHKYRQHFIHKESQNVALRGAFIQECGPYVEIDGFSQPIHVDDPILNLWELGSH
ncbi:hypothetical protein EV360DRAFT_84914 [Lentinula raphanica]|nr:hypothetical protein EV360DRAFT_84914 [Lentinula raphanica]